MSMLICRSALTLVAATSLLVGTMGDARADFVFVSQSAVYNPTSGDVQFTIEFNQAPDFFTLDSYGRVADSFQYLIYGDRSLPYPELFDAMIWSDEIHITGDTLRIRDSAPSDPDPNSGGWGPIRGAVPFTLDGDVLTFSAPLSLISDHSTDGHFDYRLGTFEFGGLTRLVEGQSTVLSAAVPEPSAAILVAMAGVILGCWRVTSGVRSSRRTGRG